MKNTSQAGGVGPDLLSSILEVTIRNEEKIAAEDRAFCEDRQAKLHATLRQLQGWYDTFTTAAEHYRESHNVVYEANGSVDTCRLRRFYHERGSEDYTAFEFLPIKAINYVVELYGKAVRVFAYHIVKHFNDKYGVSVPTPKINVDKLPMGTMPTYQPHVDAVIAHLGGKNFRETAEEELIARFHDKVTRYGGKLNAERKGDRIVFPDLICFDSFYRDLNGTNHIHSGYTDGLAIVCEGIGFGAAGVFGGGTHSIIGFDPHRVDMAVWYRFGIGDEVAFKFFKNGRLDVKFKNVVAANTCWKRLKLHELCTE